MTYTRNDDPVLERSVPPPIVTDNGATSDMIQQTAVVNPRDLVRWGPVFAGLVVAFTLFLLLSVIMVAIGVQGIRVGDPNIDEAAGVSAIVTAIIGLVCF